MRRPTYAEVRDKIERDLDLQEELFISPEELLSYCNEAIDEAEAEIHTLSDFYFETKYQIPLVQGQSVYALPSDMYAHKIRKIIYSASDDLYPVERIAHSNKFEIIADIQQNGSSDDYRYSLEHDATEGMQLVLYPASRETSSTLMTLWYIRNAARIEEETDVIDIPEFINFIYQYMRWRCYEKEGHPNTQEALAALERQRTLMVQTLSEMVPDNTGNIEQDMSFYWEMS